MSEAELSHDHDHCAPRLLPDHLRPILAALLSGATDTAASHRLNVSPRTFTRRITELLDYFDVQTRFQAGVKIGLSGITEELESARKTDPRQPPFGVVPPR
ncbi:hypothetical protein SAMN05421812_107115 [Asanoa hainanensis]|uniref:PucR C-terminal helix-turn-helix domain-containing protein n=1 Tax=Asanoa hainanensis TaxID=560556 RepID=A0A239N324_9ACTN|nr:DNA-binding response regulator [Asanoa hainanensis]SNT48569.1 hypothetical protein SAMN05421812_107115 [Asanoa hainanensis]